MNGPTFTDANTHMILSKIRFAIGAASVLAAVSVARAAEPGMFLCRSPVVANDFWGDLVTAQQTGITLNRELAASVARKHQCPFVASATLKPIDYVAGQLAITDGKLKGWAAPQLYILYVNRPGG
jgi:hypothetical protein